MPEYGITETGLRIKRFDTILSEINAFQTEGFGVQVGANTRSFLNTLEHQRGGQDRRAVGAGGQTSTTTSPPCRRRAPP